MSRIRGKDTKPEILVRRLTHSLGYRYRLHAKDLPGRPDLVFRKRRKVIFVHGCFWHLHEPCRQYRLPTSRLEFWMPKLEGNRQRDVENIAKLRELGWDVLVIWECELKDVSTLRERIMASLRGAMRSVELFTGAGGLAIGTALAGFHHEAVVEWNPFACETLRANKQRGMDPVSHWPIYQEDVNQFDFGMIHGDIDLLAGGPPCQPFSLGGKHRGASDERNMFPAVFRAVRELKPRVVMIENVKGLLRQSFAKFFEYILLQISYPEITRRVDEEWMDHLTRLERHHTVNHELGLEYRVVFRLLNSADYGVPQRRERVIFVAFRADLGVEWSFPSPTHTQDALLWSQWVTGEYWDTHKVAKKNRPVLPARYELRVDRLRAIGEAPLGQRWLTVRDALRGLPDPEHAPRKASQIPNHLHNPGARAYPGHTGSILDEPGKTLKAGDHGVPGGENMLANYDGSLRYFTVRESARLQTFPDDFIFMGAWTEAMRQLGNAVPVTLAKSIASNIYAKLEDLV